MEAKKEIDETCERVALEILTEPHLDVQCSSWKRWSGIFVSCCRRMFAVVLRFLERMG